MALVTDRPVNFREGTFFVDVTYDDVTLRLERVYAECHHPNGVGVQIHRGAAQQPWRETVMQDGEIYDESRPFGGGFNDYDQIDGIEIIVDVL